MKNMKTKKMMLPVFCCALLLGGCSALQTSSNEAWSVSPAYSVNGITDSPEALYQLGRYYHGQRRYQPAADAYVRALLADSGFVEARNGLGVVYIPCRASTRRPSRSSGRPSAGAQSPPTSTTNLGHALCLRGDFASKCPTATA